MSINNQQNLLELRQASGQEAGKPLAQVDERRTGRNEDTTHYPGDRMSDTMGDRIRSLRKEKRMTPTRLAEIVGISKGFLHDVENDRRGTGSATLWGLAKALGTSMESLFTGSLWKKEIKIEVFRICTHCNEEYKCADVYEDGYPHAGYDEDVNR